MENSKDILPHGNKMKIKGQQFPLARSFTNSQNFCGLFYIENYIELQVLNILPRTEREYPDREGKTPERPKMHAKTAKNCKKGGENGFQSNGSCGFWGGLGVSKISQ